MRHANGGLRFANPAHGTEEAGVEVFATWRSSSLQ
jgi:hypothetical protein